MHQNYSFLFLGLSSKGNLVNGGSLDVLPPKIIFILKLNAFMTHNSISRLYIQKECIDMLTKTHGPEFFETPNWRLLKSPPMQNG